MRQLIVIAAMLLLAMSSGCILGKMYTQMVAEEYDRKRESALRAQLMEDYSPAILDEPVDRLVR